MIEKIQMLAEARREDGSEPYSAEQIQRRYGAVVWPAALFGENVFTWANGITLLRTIVCLGMFCQAIMTNNPDWNLAGLAVYWVLDIVDGFVARALDQETILGAQLDIFSDRLLVSFFYIIYLMFHPELAVVIALFLFQFNLLDLYLSNQFVRMPLRSPNYFFVIDPIIWRLSWSREGKFFNTALITIVLLVSNSAWLALPVIIGQIAGKVYSIVRLARLPLPAIDGLKEAAVRADGD